MIGSGRTEPEAERDETEPGLVEQQGGRRVCCFGKHQRILLGS